MTAVATNCGLTTSYHCITSLMSLSPFAPFLFPQHNSLPAFPESLDNLTTMKPYLGPVVCGMSSLMELSSFSNVKPPNFAATIRRHQFRLHPHSLNHLPRNILLQSSLLEHQQAECLNAIQMTLKQLQKHPNPYQPHRGALHFLPSNCRTISPYCATSSFFRWIKLSQCTLH